ncbi:DUF4232 domain-containing protein [Streptomyces niveus]|uniref:DUF4232 domain-containing protein n=1 Tax=Streptomyces niveus TaxID=193462 RepID=A0ABZ2A4N8_STRNV|nr:DUF4232 domain-containing protein [Streptomyces niveus]
MSGREQHDESTGNGTVNNGPEEEPGGDLHGVADGTRGADGAADSDPQADVTQPQPQAQTQPLAALFGGAGDAGDAGGESGGADELALRRLLHGAVQEIEPSAGALDHLRRAVPARRARKRQAFVGVAAAALLISTAVPAFVHVANTGSSSDDKSFNVGHGEQVHGGTGSDGGPKDPEKDGAGPSDAKDNGQGGSGGKDKPETSDGGSTGGTSGGDGHDPESSFTSAAATCDASQLVVSAAESGAPQADGTVYGKFRVSNNSGTNCSVSGHGSVGFQATGAADPNKIEVVDHTPGDPASGLPDPSLEATTLVLPPSGAYEVMFAWVPTDTCPKGEPSPDPSPTEGGSGGATNGTGSTPVETAPQLGSEEGPVEDGSIDVVHTPEAGSESPATTTIDNACAGTIYRTGVLEAS